jgi:hypothetical protein
VVYFEKSPDGLAAGDEVDPLLDVLPLPEVLPELLLPDVPEGVVPPELPEVLLPLPVPVVLYCAAAIAGANAMTAAKRARTSFRILTSFGL